MSGRTYNKVVSNLEEVLQRKIWTTRRCQLDFERSSALDYDYEPERKFEPEKCGETEYFKEPRDVSQKALDWIGYEPRFKYFLDGSRRTFRIADIPFDSQCFPIVAGQVGVGVCQRKEKKLSVYGDFRVKIVLALPQKLDEEGKKSYASHQVFFSRLCDQINQRLENDPSGRHILIDKILFYNGNTDDNFEDKAVSTIQSYMIEQEKRAVQNLVDNNCLDGDSWLLKDGSLEYAQVPSDNSAFSLSRILNNYKCVVGVSKSFNPELVRLKNKKSASKTIAMLREGERTPVFRYTTDRSEGTFAVWYLRLRNFGANTKTAGNGDKYADREYSFQKKRRYCLDNWGTFDGIVKVEKLLVTRDEKENGLKTNLVDNISAWILNERNPVCYGKDSRWVNHLYPIYLTETFVKSRFLSEAHFINLF